MMPRRLTICRGLPGAGKTSWCEEQIRLSRLADPGAARISRDDVRALLFGAPGYGIDEPAVTRMQHAMIRAALKASIPVWVDDTNMAVAHLERLTGTGVQMGAQVVVADHFLQVPVETCIERDLARERPVGEAVIRGMWDRYEDET